MSLPPLKRVPRVVARALIWPFYRVVALILRAVERSSLLYHGTESYWPCCDRAGLLSEGTRAWARYAGPHDLTDKEGADARQRLPDGLLASILAGGFKSLPDCLHLSAQDAPGRVVRRATLCWIEDVHRGILRGLLCVGRPPASHEAQRETMQRAAMRHCASLAFLRTPGSSASTRGNADTPPTTTTCPIIATAR